MPGLTGRTVRLHPIGERTATYEETSSLDGVHLDLEAGEQEPSTGGRCRVEASGAEGWSLPDSTLVLVTNRRLAWLTTAFDQGGGWVGTGGVGLLVATTANAVSRRRAAERSAGKIAIGHVRHEWVSAVRLRRRKALIGLVDTYVDVDLDTTQGRVTIELWGKSLANAEFARWLSRVIAHERLLLADESLAEPDRIALRTLAAGTAGADFSFGSSSGQLWTFPGDRALLVDAALKRHNIESQAREARP